jgi:hypothetical protein
MKANRLVKLKTNQDGFIAQVGGLVALMVTIIIAIMVYWSVSPNVAPSSVYEEFTGYTHGTGSSSTGGSNYTAQTVTLQYAPYSETNSTMTLETYSPDQSSGVPQCPPKTIDMASKQVTVQAGETGAGTAGNPRNYTQINVTYTTLVSEQIKDNVNPTANTVFNLLPVIAIVVIGSILIGLVMGFGKKPET